MVYSGIVVERNNITEIWDEWYEILLSQEKVTKSRYKPVVGEVINAVTILTEPRNNILQSAVRKMSIKYAVGELLWYLSGSNKLSDILPYAKFWKDMSDDGVTLNSAYGYRIHNKYMFDQWEYVKQLLTLDPNSRQAIIHIKEPSPISTKDLPCTICLQYLLREGALYGTTYMRSNDIWLGFPYDVFAFSCMQTKLAMELGVELGSYTHIAGSLHLYEGDNDVEKNTLPH